MSTSPRRRALGHTASAVAAGAGVVVALGLAAVAVSAPASADTRGQGDARSGAATAGRTDGGAANRRPDTPTETRAAHRRTTPTPVAAPDHGTVTPRAAARVVAVAVDLPPMPVSDGLSFTVTRDAVAQRARDYVAAGGDPADAPRFFFGDLAVESLDALAVPDASPAEQRANLGNLAVSGYFGGVWLRDNLRSVAPPDRPTPEAQAAAPPNLVSALGIRLFDVVAAGLTQVAAIRSPRLATTAARLSVPVLLTLYGYNRGYLEFLLDNPPAGTPSMRESLSCSGFLNCSSDAFPLDMANRYDGALAQLVEPPDARWQEMAAWTALLEGATTASGRLVWNAIATAGAFSPVSYGALVELSSAYLMVSKAAVLAAMTGYADADADTARASLRLQAGLWMWSGAYFGGLASSAPAGTLPEIVAVPEGVAV